MKNVLVIVGPTCVGKTYITSKVANKLNGEVIYADSAQVYKFMDIGTAKPSKEEKLGINHYLIDFLHPDDDFSVAKYSELAKNYIIDISNRDKTPIVSGGTGLYINSLLYNMDFANNKSDSSIRDRLNLELKEKGAISLYNKLKELDPNAAEKIHPNNHIKLIRAIEINEVTGNNVGDFSKDIDKNTEFNFKIIGLNRNRDELYSRINTRVDIMIQNGLIEEVESLLKRGYDENLPALRALGYKEIISYIRGNNTKCDSIRILKKNTRRFAKRQLTWFRRYEDVNWMNLSKMSEDECIEKIIKLYEEEN